MKFQKQGKRAVYTSTVILVLTAACVATNTYVFARQPILPEKLQVTIVRSGSQPSHSNASSPHDVIHLSMSEGKIQEHDIRSYDKVIYDNDGAPWNLQAGQEVAIELLMEGRNSPTGQGTLIGYLFEGQDQLIFSEQIKSGARVRFTVPQSGEYFFYVHGYSSDSLLVNSITIQVTEQ